MQTKTLNFSLDEYAERLRKTRAAMEKRGIDTLIISDPANMHWLTGYDGWSFYVHQAVVVPPSGDPIWFGRGIDAAGAMRTCYFGNENIASYPDHYVHSPERHPMELLGKLLVERKLGKGVIGIEKDAYWFSAAAYETLMAGLPNARFTDATVLVNWERLVKSPAEIAFMRKAARIIELMHKRIYEKVEPGMRKCDLAAEIYDAAIRGTSEFGGDYPALVPLLPSGADAAACHLTWDDRPMRNNEGTFFEIAGVYRRYHCPMSRTVYLGKPSQTFLNAEKMTLEGMEAGLAVAKPGAAAEDIAIAFCDVLERYGIRKENRVGYSVGCAYPPDWGEHAMSLRRGDKTELQPGITFHFMTGLWMEDWGFEMTETVLITETGMECLANVPRQLFVKN
ncbi:ectoine hydrolase DoeA [Mesorhizobium sp. YC-39]|uniref:ectoine hydrolase DoeA n=1 Tax=unclassified Mesorhizobium TaxID=325217 RepID=UPI0021E953DB|nr:MULTISPECIES: ectoine hydrolase DoeA [unclassified Mesorhizobium]MCV3211495.1 ectoine hydrolase DoeA [Mesorhizobium sp. YC-2]MCV3233149.1 ectoine hydrolase DoeA [Mesorhizobium sp. YC-39]